MPYRKIIVSGFTAAGKTTHARLLAADLGWSYVGMAPMRKEILEQDAHLIDGDVDWSQVHDDLRGTDYTIDLRADKRMLEVVSSRDFIVVDAWLQPWLYDNSDALKLWIESSVESRLRKAAVAFLRRGEEPLADLDKIIDKKDSFSVETFRRLYGISFSPDPNIFDAVHDNSALIEYPTIEASDRGIGIFREVLLRDISNRLGQARNE